MKRHFIWVLVLSCLWVVSSNSLGVGDEWTKKADMPKARAWHSACAVDGRIYVFGGLFVNTILEEYDPATDKWARKTDMPTGRDSFSVEVVNGKIYAIAGEDAGQMALSSMDEYDPATDTWAKKANALIKRRDFTTGMVNGKIYVIGGTDGGPSLATVEEYDPLADKWSMKNNMPNGSCFLRASAVNGKIYVIGGDTNAALDAPSKIVEEYDPVADKWSKKADVPTARINHSTCVSNGKIYTIGGSGAGGGGSWGEGIATVEEYDPENDLWVTKADMPTARFAFSTAVVNGKIYAIGGSLRGAGNLPVPAVEEYIPEGWLFTVSPQDNLATSWGEIKSKQ